MWLGLCKMPKTEKLFHSNGFLDPANLRVQKSQGLPIDIAVYY